MNIDGTGIFHFDEIGKFISFESNDRCYNDKDGKFVKKRFSAVVDNYKEKNRLQIPKNVRIIWNLKIGIMNILKGKYIIYNITK